jgi:metallophosphoesterase (TIGR00282 family)
LKVLFIGDIFGESGRNALKMCMPELKSTYNPDFCIANGENAAGGRGISYNTAQEIFDTGIDAITMGNHTWARKEILRIIDSGIKIVRPANYPKGVPGKGRIVIEKNGIRLAVVNLLGRIYLDQPVDCPFQTIDRELSFLKGQADFTLVDFHAEATSEKIAMGYYLDGRVSCMVGTHTHVQTADDKILEKGTAFISDVGMTGPAEGVIGVDKELIIKKFTLGLPVQHEPAKGKAQINAVIVTLNEENNRASEIKRINSIVKI